MTTKHLQILSRNDSPKKLSDTEKIQKLEHLFYQVLETLELDLSDPSLAKTPNRIARMYVNELFSGLQKKNFPSLTLQETTSDGMVFVKNIPLFSTCEHHFLPMTGFAYFAYFPNKKIIGLSKINRIIHFFSRRPQLQERLTKQIADSLSHHLETENIALLTKATHLCMTARGVRDHSSETEVLILKGKFEKEDCLKRDFLILCEKK